MKYMTDIMQRVRSAACAVRPSRLVALLTASIVLGLACDRLRDEPVFFPKKSLPEFHLVSLVLKS